jgi:hypothetical protein
MCGVGMKLKKEEESLKPQPLVLKPICCANLLCQSVVPTCCANLLCQSAVPICCANLLSVLLCDSRRRRLLQQGIGVNRINTSIIIINKSRFTIESTMIASVSTKQSTHYRSLACYKPNGELHVSAAVVVAFWIALNCRRRVKATTLLSQLAWIGSIAL